MDTYLKISGLTKMQNRKTLLSNLSLEVRKGEVLGIAERTGDAVPTLIDLFSGRTVPDHGEIILNGSKLEWPIHPGEYRISILYEEPELVENLDVASNIFLGNENGRAHHSSWLQVLNHHSMHQQAGELLSGMGVFLPSITLPVYSLSTEQKQLIVLAQIMAAQPEIIIIQNPGRTLSLPYQEKLLQLMKNWQQNASTVVLCSTNLDLLFAAADRIAVFREGSLSMHIPTDRTNREKIVDALVGSEDRQHITPVIWALDSYYDARKQTELLQYNQELLERSLAEQDSINKHLLNQLSTQVKALDRANIALQDAQRRLLTEREQERKHLARELHDQQIQDLLSLSYQLEEIEQFGKHPAELLEKVHYLRQHTREMIENLRRICGDLRPPTIDSLGLMAALKSYTNNWSEQTGITLELLMDKEIGRLPEKIELAVFRIVQEGLNNIRNHSDASEVSVSLTHTSPRMLKIIISDNGIGLKKNFDLASLGKSGHFGLLGITERVALMGGSIQFKNISSGGLRIEVDIPHPRLRSTPTS